MGSEFPAPAYRNKIESILSIPTVSWYGHTERCVLAGDHLSRPYEYYPFHTYGFVEAVQAQDGEYSLVATSFHNHTSPFIRYDTEDRILPLSFDGRYLTPSLF